jgi:carboxylesterase type B
MWEFVKGLPDGGFLQFGSNNSEDPSNLLYETEVKCIIVSPGYRLGVFGFLASKEICGNKSPAANFGFWDQRLALEWTYDNVEFFGGNKDNITVGGLSAGSYATFHQLAHDIGPNSKRQIIRRVFQWSNGCGVEPKRVLEMQEQFDDLLSVLQISASWGTHRKLAALRKVTSDELVQAVDRMKQKFFRPILDGEFMSEDLFQNLFNGSFGKRMRELGIQTVIGDLTQEFHIYKRFHPPNSYESLINRLSWDYPHDIAVAISAPYKPSTSAPSRTEDEWAEIFGKLYADMQIHSTMRGFLNSIASSVPLPSINRYRIDWRTQSIDRMLPRDVGATHGTDLTIWLFGLGAGLTPPEKELIRKWLQPVTAFIKGEDFDWGTNSISQVRYLTAEGKIEIKEDEVWEGKLPLWNVTKQVTRSRASAAKAKF